MKRNPVAIVLSYLAVYIIWGSTYLGIKWAVDTIPPFMVVSFRFLLGGIVFLTASWLTGKIKTLPKAKEVLSAMFLGTLLLLFGNGMISWAQQKVDSYFTALIVSSTPFCVALFNWLFFRERLSWVRFTGIILGVTGVAVILQGGAKSFGFSFHLALIFCGFLSWSLATSLGHKLKVHPSILVNSGMQMLFVGLVALVLSRLMYGPLLQTLPQISLKSFLGLIYLAVFGGIGFYAYSYLLNNEPAIRVSSYAIINPMIAVLLGVFLGNEKPVSHLIFGMPVILLGLALMMYGEMRRSVKA